MTFMTGFLSDKAGFTARGIDGLVWCRRNPGEESCGQCVASPTGFCARHQEFYPLHAEDGEQDGPVEFIVTDEDDLETDAGDAS